jgi:hypothetical protein
MRLIHMRVLDGIAIYPCIDIPYGLNEHPRVDFFKFNPQRD